MTQQRMGARLPWRFGFAGVAHKVPRRRDEGSYCSLRSIAACRLWLGHVGDARNLGAVHAAGIAALVDLALNESPIPLARELVYCRFPLIDGGGNPAWRLRAAVQTVAGLLRAQVPTLVYCGAGMSRTPAVAGAAIALVRGCPLTDGLALATQSGAVDLSPALWSDIQAAVAEQGDAVGSITAGS